MKRVGESGEGGAEKEENLGEKLRRGVLVGKRGGPSTPVVSSWGLLVSAEHGAIINHPVHHQQPQPSSSIAIVSARKLAASLWEFHHYQPLHKMQNRGGAHSHSNGGGPPPRLRHLHHHHHLHKDKGLHLSNFLVDNCPSSPEQVHTLFSDLGILSFGFGVCQVYNFPILIDVKIESFSLFSLLSLAFSRFGVLSFLFSK